MRDPLGICSTFSHMHFQKNIILYLKLIPLLFGSLNRNMEDSCTGPLGCHHNTCNSINNVIYMAWKSLGKRKPYHLQTVILGYRRAIPKLICNRNNLCTKRLNLLTPQVAKLGGSTRWNWNYIRRGDTGENIITKLKKK